MIKEAIGEASTIEEAKENAKKALNAPVDADVGYDVIAMPQKKLFGLFGGSGAKIKAFYDDGKPEVKKEVKSEAKAEPKAAPKAQAKEQPKKENKKTVNEAPASRAPRQEEKKDLVVMDINDDKIAQAKEYLETIISALKVEGAVVSVKIEDESVKMDIDCDDYGIIIGRRGETLDSIQYLISLILNKNVDGYVRVSLNVGNYRQKRRETLTAVAKKNASYVLRSGRRVVLEPMNPYERRIIHTTVQSIDGVESRSVGSNSERKVVIELAPGVEPTGGHSPKGQKGGYNRSGGAHTNSRSDRDDRPSPSAPRKKLDRNDMPKFGKID